MELEKLIHAAVLVPLDDPASPLCRWGLPLLIWGMPGIGKSERVVIGALKAGLTTKQIYAPRFMPDDPSGVCTPDGHGDVKIVCTMTAVRELKEIGSGVLFIDELSSSKEATQASFLGVVLDRDVAGERMPGRVRILAAANPPEVAANGRELLSPFANRLCHIHLELPSAGDWADWVMKGSPMSFIEVTQGEELIKEKWQYEFKRASAIFSQGMRRNPKLLHAMPSEESGQRGTAWPSPRTWEFAMRAYATCKALGYGSDISDVLVEGCVGEGAATEMLRWIKEQELPDPADIIKGDYEPDVKRMDRSFIIYNSVTQYVLSQTDKVTRLQMGIELWKLFAKAESAGMLDTVIDCVTLTVKSGLGRKAHHKIHELATPILTRIGDTGMLETE